MTPSLVDPPLLASLIAAIVLAALGFANARSRDGRAGVAIALGCALVLVQGALYWRDTVDDSFIAFRFARHWAQGLGPVYQAGERVEGYTCFLWVSLLALAARLGLDIELTAKALGLACAFGCVFAVRELARALAVGARVERLAPIVLGLSPLFAAWTFAGMDAPLFAALLCWAAARFVHERNDARARPASALLFGVLVLARPEGVLFAGLAWLFLGSRGGGLGTNIRHAAAWSLLFAAIALPYWLWRWHYYDAFLPNTFYAKAAMGLRRGLRSLFDFGADTGVLAVALAVLGAFVAARNHSARFVLVSLAAFFAYVLWAGGDVLHLRFYVHVLPLWATVVAIGLDRLLARLEARRASLVPATAFVLALAWVAVGYAQHVRARAPRDQFGVSYVADNASNLRHAHAPLGEWLKAHAPAGSRVAARDIGALGYRSELPLIDLYGLTDRAIARLIHARASAEELTMSVEARSPEFFVLYGTSQQIDLAWLAPGERWLAEHYRRHSFWPDSPRDKGLVLLVRNDVHVAEAPPRKVDEGRP